MPPGRPRKLQTNDRRFTLPISITIPNESFLKPLKVSKVSRKRYNDNDARPLNLCKLKRTELVVRAPVAPRILDSDLRWCAYLITPKPTRRTAIISIVPDELKSVWVMETQGVHQAEEIKTIRVESDEIIDLTEDADPVDLTGVDEPSVKPESDVKGRIAAPSNSSEPANVPLSPTTQPIRILPESLPRSQPQPPPLDLLTQLASQRNPIHPPQNQRKTQGQANSVKTSRQPHQAKKPAQQKPRRSTEKQQTLMPAPQPQTPTQYHHAHPPQPLPAVPQHHQPTSNLQHQLSQLPPAPQLLKLLRPRRQPEFRLVTNAACGERLFPHLYVFSRWRSNADRFYQDIKSFLSHNLLKDDLTAFRAYADHATANFGRKLVKELSLLDVANFNISEIANVISMKLLEKSCVANVFKTCVSLHLMLKSCEEQCMTPFAKKFYKTVEMCVERMKQRSQQAPVFTLSQLKLLEMQIRQYVAVKNWVEVYNSQAANAIHPLGWAGAQCAGFRLSTSVPVSPTQIPETVQTRSPPIVGEQRNKVVNALLQNLHENIVKTRPGLEVTPVAVQSDTLQQRIVENNKEPPVQVLVRSSIEIPGEPPKDTQPPTPPREASPEISTHDEVIDLTWIDDGDENEMLEEITECKTFPFPFKVEDYAESDSESTREAVSPVDSGLGSPSAQTGGDGFECLCGKNAIYVCACNESMYCSRKCQINDWSDHQRWCQEAKNLLSDETKAK